MGSCCTKDKKGGKNPGMKPKPVTSHPILATAYKSEKIFHFIDLASSPYFDSVANILLRLQKNNSLYEDMTFPPSVTSLTADLRRFKRAEGIVWLRPQQFFSEQPVEGEEKQEEAKSDDIALFKSKIEPNDVKQGELGDCYFLSALTVLAENPSLIERLFESESFNEQGCYAVWLCINGEWKQFIVDDNIPCKKDSGKPAFSRTHGKELWVALIEKAYSKAYGSYENIEIGIASEALRDLTGAPGEYLMYPEAETAWESLKKWAKQEFMLTASTEHFEGKEERDLLELGLVEGHCYAVLDVREVAHHGDAVRLIKLRNPWGRKEWQGDWSDKSEKWTPELRKELAFENSDDGVFWMSLNDFCLHFCQIGCTKVFPGFFYSSINLSQPDSKRAVLVSFTASSKANGYFSLNQRDKRIFMHTLGASYDYSFVRIFVVRQGEGPNEILNCAAENFEQDRNVCVHVQLEPGRYLVYLQIDWNPTTAQGERTFNLSFYGSELVSMSEQQSATELQVDQFLIAHALSSSSEKTKVFTYDDPDIRRYAGSAGGYLYFMYKNNSKVSTLKEDIELNEVSNIVLKNDDNPNGERKFHVELKPETAKILFFRVGNLNNGSFLYKLSSSFYVLTAFDRKTLVERALNEPSKVKQRKIKDNLVEVFLYLYNYSGGVAVLYVNKTTMTFKESLKLSLQNLILEDFDQDNIKIQIKPQENFLLNLKIVDENLPISYKMSFTCALS